MENEQQLNKVFGLTRRGGQHWFVSDPYSDREIEALVDPDGGRGTALPTAIPSPFARIDLVKTAFNNISKTPGLRAHKKNNAVIASREDEKLVSDALDIFEMLFNIDSLKDRVKIRLWERDKELEILKNGIPEHRRLADTLELYFREDAEAYNFGHLRNFYLIECDHVIIGCSSPVTFFFASGNDLTHAQIKLTGNDVAFDDNYAPLYKRDEQFQKYVYLLFRAYPDLRSRMRQFDDYLSKNLQILRADNPTLFDVINRLQPAELVNDYTELDTGISGQTIDVLNGITLRKRKPEGVIATVSNSDFVIASDKYEGNNKPLVLQNHLVKANFRYASDMWDNKIDVPYFDPENDLNKRRLPGLSIHYPYLTVSDFLETQLVRLIYPVHKEKFFDGNTTVEAGDESKGYLLPLKPAFFEYFNTEDLVANKAGKPKIEMIQGSAGSVKVILKIPVKKSGESISFERIYYASADGTLPATDPSQKKGGIVEHQVSLTLFPFIKITTPQIQPYYRTQFIDRDKYGAQKDSQFELRFFQDAQRESIPLEATKNRRVKSVDIVTSQYYVLNQNFDYIQLSNLSLNGASAIIIPKWPVYQPGNEVYQFAVDFGTTNTHIEYKNSSGGPTAFDIKRNEIQIGTLFHPDKLEGIKAASADDIYTLIDYEFVPKLIGNGEEFGFPQRTVLAESHSLNINGETTYALADFNIPFTYERRKDKDKIQANLKWAKRENGNEIRVRAYFETLIMLMRNKVMFGNGNLSETKLTWFYPSSMTPGRKGQLESTWNELFSKYFNTNTHPVGITESLAPFYYFKATNKIQGGAYKPVVSIDIGGGTTDVVVYKNNKPLLLTSFKFAANTLFGDGFSEYGSASSSGLIRKYLPHYENLLRVNKYHGLSEVLAAIQAKNRSEDINAFFFSIENNAAVSGSKQFSYNALLSKDEDIKIVFLYFYSAIIFHVAHLMKSQQVEMPKHLIFSGTGSKILNVITADKAMLNQLSALIFEKVYQSPPDQDGLTIETEKEKPKEVTCKGGLMSNDEDLVIKISSIKRTLTCLDSPTLAYNQLNDQVKQDIVTYLNGFNDFFLSLDKDLNFKDNFNISPASLALFKKEVGKHLRDYLENGLEYNKRMDEIVDDDKELEESLFFYPLIGTIHNLISQLSQLSPIIH